MGIQGLRLSLHCLVVNRDWSVYFLSIHIARTNCTYTSSQTRYVRQSPRRCRAYYQFDACVVCLIRASFWGLNPHRLWLLYTLLAAVCGRHTHVPESMCGASRVAPSQSLSCQGVSMVCPVMHAHRSRILSHRARRRQVRQLSGLVGPTGPQFGH